VDKKNTTPKQMYDELAVMSNLAHDNIVRFFEIFNRPDGYYVILERINGGELFDRIIALQSYTESQAVRVMRQALNAIKHMHDLDFIHRDLKPENLLLSSQEEDANIKLADFGFTAKIKEKGLRSIVGTPPYMAPELVRLRSGNKRIPGYGKSVDNWALGVILYILLSGMHPLQIDDEEEMLDNIEKGEWEWLGDWDKVSEEAKDLIRRLMDPNYESRLTVDQALEHPWITGEVTSEENLTGAQEMIRKFQARKKLKGAIYSVIATNRLRRSLLALKQGNDEGAAGEDDDVDEPVIIHRNEDDEDDSQ